MAFCSFCGKPLQEGAAFCGNCGRPVASTAGPSESSSMGSQSEKTSGKGNSWFEHLNDYVGNEGSKDLNWRVLFSEVTQNHTSEEAEEVFIYGTRKTTPSINDVSKDWPHPWLYSRVFIVLAIAFVMLWICCNIFSNSNALPGLIVVGSFAGPLAVLIMAYELNIWRNISFLEVFKIFFVGGCASLVVTLLLFSLVGQFKVDYIGAFIISIVEEIGKAVIVYYFLKRLGKTYVLCGLLIGAAVGAGFAAFESAGYALNHLQGGLTAIVNSILLRGFMSPGGHVVWAAMSGVGFVIAAQSLGEISTSLFTHAKFLRLFAIPVVLHGLWDAAAFNMNGGLMWLILIGLTVFAWVIVLILVNMGLAEVSKVQNNTGQVSNNL